MDRTFSLSVGRVVLSQAGMGERWIHAFFFYIRVQESTLYHVCQSLLTYFAKTAVLCTQSAIQSFNAAAAKGKGPLKVRRRLHTTYSKFGLPLAKTRQEKVSV